MPTERAFDRRPPEPREPREARLAAIFAECSDRLNAGQDVDLDRVIAAHPDLEPELSTALLCLRALGSSKAPLFPGATSLEGILNAPAEQPEPMADFEILRELGRGGMGEVYLAKQKSLGRLVALKIIAPAIAGRPDAVERFFREARTAGSLDHPSLISIYDSGVMNGRPYIVMRYVEGETLAEKISAARIAGAGGKTPPAIGLPAADGDAPGSASVPRDSSGRAGRGSHSSSPSQRSDLFRVVAFIEAAARALQVAHEAHLIHRDIKPRNIMVTKDGLPVILDFGLARLEDEELQRLTQSGDLLGTPAYMSPEQLMAQRVRLDRRSDVYSLGVTLYECLTLRLPFEAPTREALFQAILTKDPPDPRSFNAQISKDLEVVMQTALEKDRDRRYHTALDFAEDLRRVREYEPIRARPPGPATRVQRWVQRNPVIATALCLITLALGVSLLLLRQLSLETAAKDRALRRGAGLRLVAQSSAVLNENPGLALLLAIEAADRVPGSQASSACLEALGELQERLTLVGHESPIDDAAFSPDGGRVATSSEDNTARLWDASSGVELVTVRGHAGPIRSVAFSRDGRHLITASSDGTARTWPVDPVSAARDRRPRRLTARELEFYEIGNDR